MAPTLSRIHIELSVVFAGFVGKLKGGTACELASCKLCDWAHYTLPFSFNWKSLVIVAFTGGRRVPWQEMVASNLCMIKLSIKTLKLKGVFHELRHMTEMSSKG
jgi:hypothetical protein